MDNTETLTTRRGNQKWTIHRQLTTFGTQGDHEGLGVPASYKTIAVLFPWILFPRRIYIKIYKHYDQYNCLHYR